LVNLSHLEKVGKGKSSYLIMADEATIPLSANKKPLLEDLLGL